MSNRWFNLAVVLLWLASMSWLIAEKVAPPLRVGDRPTTTADEDPVQAGPISWELFLNDQPLGWATTDSLRRPDQVLEVHNRLHLQRFPLKEIAPWLARMLDPGGRDADMAFDTESRVEIAGERLRGFRTSISLGELKDAILVHGTAEDDQLKLRIRAGDFNYNTTADLRADAPMGDSLSPRSQLRNLRVGQKWTEPVYNPLHPPNSPLQVLEATVERNEPMVWNGQIIKASVVVYRDDPGSEKASYLARARAWVEPDGDVLKQEVYLWGVKLLFVRLPPGKTLEGSVSPEASRSGNQL